MHPNPISVRVDVDESTTPPQATMRLSLQPDALLLRTRFRALIAHFSNAPHPFFWDLGKDMELLHAFPCYGAPLRITITCYGLRPDNLLELLFRNWGEPADGLPLPQG